jgi:hypothetical protein
MQVLHFPFQNESCLRTEDIIKVIEEQGDSIALILFGGNLKTMSRENTQNSDQK